MPKIRLFILLSTFLVVGVFGSIAIFYAQGYRINGEELTVSLKGLLVANSDPNGAQVYIDGILNTATDNTIDLEPGTHEVKIQKEGFLTWQKNVEVKTQEVIQVNALLVPRAPSLSALTFAGAHNPVISQDLTKIAFAILPSIPPAPEEEDMVGLWVFELNNLPLGFTREPKQVTDGDLTLASWEFSPDTNEILLTTKRASFLLDNSKLTPQTQLINISSTVQKIRNEWQQDSDKKLDSLLSKLPKELKTIFLASTKNILFSPDENKILYTASGSATIKEGLITPLPGSSTQPEARTIKDNNIYTYDIKEDKNFHVGEPGQVIYWLPNSLNLINPKSESVIIMDYDGNNLQPIFTGSYLFPFAFPSGSTDRVLILTNFGSLTPNLYWLGLK